MEDTLHDLAVIRKFITCARSVEYKNTWRPMTQFEILQKHGRWPKMTSYLQQGVKAKMWLDNRKRSRQIFLGLGFFSFLQQLQILKNYKY